MVGNVQVPISSSEHEFVVPVHRVFGRVLSDLFSPCSSYQHAVHADADAATFQEGECQDDISNFKSARQRASPIPCGNCLGLGHSAKNCSSPI